MGVNFFLSFSCLLLYRCNENGKPEKREDLSWDKNQDIQKWEA